MCKPCAEYEAMRDPIAWALSIQAEWERAEAEDDEFRSENVHNHPPYRPVCNERQVGERLRGACLNDDGTSVIPSGTD